MDLALHRITFFAKKGYVLRNLRNIQAEAKNRVSYKKQYMIQTNHNWVRSLCFLSKKLN